MLNAEQKKYLESLKVTHPNLTNEYLENTFSGAGWPHDEIVEAVAMYRAKPEVVSAPLSEAAVVGGKKHTMLTYVVFGIFGLGVVATSFFVFNQSSRDAAGVVERPATVEINTDADMTQVDDETLAKFEKNIHALSEYLLIKAILLRPDTVSIADQNNFEENWIKLEQQTNPQFENNSDVVAYVRKIFADARNETKPRFSVFSEVIESAFMRMQNEEPSLASELRAVREGKQIQDASTRFKYVLLSKVSADPSLAELSLLPTALTFDGTVPDDPVVISEMRYMPVISVLDERVGRLDVDAALGSLISQGPRLVTEAVNMGILKTGSNLCAHPLLDTYIKYVDTYAKNLGDTRPVICRESASTFVIYTGDPSTGFNENTETFSCRGMNASGVYVEAFNVQDTSKTYCAGNQL
jgi:hypothetical protein